MGDDPVSMGIVWDLCDGDLSIERVAGRNGMSVAELAHWASREDNAAMMRAMGALAEARAVLVAALGRVTAAGVLRSLVEDKEESRETRRKACVDLLKLDVGGVNLDPSAAASAEAKADEGEIRKLLARSGSAEELGQEEAS